MGSRLLMCCALAGLAACGDDDAVVVDGGGDVDGAVDAALADAAADAALPDAAADADPLAPDAAPPADAGPCPADFVLAANGRCYLIVATPINWPSARDQCGALGASLAQDDDAAENGVISALAGFDAWIGGYDAIVEGTWLWTDGQPITFQPWAPGEPDDASPGQDCLVLLDDGTWSDLACGDARGYVCEII